MTRVLFVHASAELYGSDRALLALVDALRPHGARATVVLPSSGPLRPRLEALGATVLAAPVGKLARGRLRGAGPAAWIQESWRAQRVLDRTLDPGAFDLVHSNTLAVTAGAAWARRHRLPHLWHVHELIERPAPARRALAALLAWGADRAVFNSAATRRCWVAARADLARHAAVVPYGVTARPACAGAGAALRGRLGIGPEAPLVALVGRISRWKGQRLLIAAAERAAARGLHQAVFLFVGGAPPGQPQHLAALAARVARSPVRERLLLLPYEEDVGAVWDACDVAVVPSTDPEPFGIVAVEAMLAERPVIAAAHGGLAEIVAPGQTGLLVPPRDPDALAQALLSILAEPERRQAMGRSGRARAEARYGLARYGAALAGEYAALAEHAAGLPRR